MHSLLQDLRYGLRTFGRNPGFTAIALLTLALGIGANTGLFTVVSMLVHMPERFEEPEKLVYLRGESHEPGHFGRRGVSPADYLDWRGEAGSFDEMAAMSQGGYALTGNGDPEQLEALRATANLLPMLGVEAQLGRFHDNADDLPGAARVVSISYSLWERKFGRSPGVLGQVVLLDDQPHTIIGVLTPGINEAWLWDDVDLWMPLALDPSQTDRSNRWLTVLARLESDISIERARTEMSGITARIAEAYPESNRHYGVRLETLEDWIYPPEARLGMNMLLGVAILVLLIACANLAGLLLAKASARGRELAIRTALGANRARIIRQLLTESLLLALIGGWLGLMLGAWGIDLLAASITEVAAQGDRLGVSPAVLVYTIFASLMAALAFGLAPALRISKAPVFDSLKEGTATASTGRGRQRLRSALIVGQIALALPLLVCSTLLIKSMLGLRSVELGFNPEQLLTLRIDLPQHRYDHPAQQADFFADAVEAIEAMPCVELAAATRSIPMGRVSYNTTISVEGRTTDPTTRGESVGHSVVSADYFKVLEIPLLAGRLFTEHDNAGAERVTIINQQMAERYWPDQSPIGGRFRQAGDEANTPWIRVVGVVGNTSGWDLGGPAKAEMFLNAPQQPSASMHIVARTSGDPLAAVPLLRRAFDRVDPDQPFHDICTMRYLVDRRINDGAVVAWLIAGLGVIALGIACLGLYGVMSISVTQRIHEIGVRKALGADNRTVLRLVLKRTLVLAAVAVLIGLALAAAVSRLLTSYLYEISPADPATYIGITGMLLTVAFVAGYIPARRATKVDPMVALRCE